MLHLAAPRSARVTTPRRGLAAAAACALALAGSSCAAAQRGTAAGAGPSGAADAPGWAPRVPLREEEDRVEIRALLAALERADERGDATAAAALMDFPVLMASDDRRGERVAETWGRERWLDAMAPLYTPIPGVAVAHHPTVFLVSDSLALAVDDEVITLGGRQLPGRAALLLVRTGGAWRIKAMVEGGWGEALRAMTAAPEPRPR